MLRLVALLAFAAIALGQMPNRPARVSIDTTGAGDLHATLTVPTAYVPTGLPAAFATAVGCGTSGLEKSPYDFQISVRCPGTRPSTLTYHAAVRLAELTPLLRQTGADRVDVALTTPHFHSLRLDPVLNPRGRKSDGYYHAQYSLDQSPQQIVIDGGFELNQALILIACAVGLILAPLLLILPRPSDALRLRVRSEGIFVLGWICWLWVWLRLDAAALLSYLSGRWAIGSLVALAAPPLAAVWIGSRLAAVEYARLTPNGLGVDHYRHLRFWSGAAATCFIATFLNALLLRAPNAFGSLFAGFALVIICR